MKKHVALLVQFFLSLSAFSQTGDIIGEISDQNAGTPVSNAVIAIFTPSDSILYSFTRSDANGKYVLKNIPAGPYLLMASHPRFADIYFDITVSQTTEVPEIKLISKASLLEEIVVNTGKPLRIKGDTTIYTADSFKVGANANVEELLKKLPGIQVDKDGKIQAMGETVQKVLVDGEEFFGDDPGMAVKNLRADAVKEVQVFDKKSEQAEFTGIDDGNTQKTINLKLKDNSKKGYFGKADISGGPIKDLDPRYNANLLFSSFKGKRKIAAFALNGNTGQDGLSWEDEQKYNMSDYTTEIGDDGSIMMYSSGNDGEAYINTENGYLTNLNAGLLYSNKWLEKYNINISPKYNEQRYDNRTQSYTRSQIGDSVLIRNADEFSHVVRNNMKLRAIADVQIDSFNSIKLTATTNFYHTENHQISEMATTGESGVLKNTSERDLNSIYDKAALSGNLIYRHKFKKDRRTLAFTGNWYALENKGTTFLESLNTAFLDGAVAGAQDLNQKKMNETSTQNLSGQFTYTEPLSKQISLQISYRIAVNEGSNNQTTFNYSDLAKKYTDKVDSLSNNFRQSILQNVPSTLINFAGKKLKLNVGSGFGFTNFDLKDITFGKEYRRNYTNFYPQANATFTYKPNHTINFRYNGYTRQPSVDQLQPLHNNTDYFNQRIGNPNLQPAFSHSFNVFHQNYNFLKDFWTYQSAYIQFTQNDFATSSIVDLDSGKTVSQTVNVNGNYFIGIQTGMSYNIKKLKTRVSFGPQFNANRYAQFINGKKALSTVNTPGLRVGLDKSKENRYELSLSNRVTYNINSSTQSNSKIEYLTNTINFFGKLYIQKVWSLNIDYDYYYRQRSVPGGQNLNTHLLNARLQRTFHRDEFTIYLMGRDLLNQNIGIERSIYQNVYSEVINDRLKRYFMIGFTWNFKNNGPK